MTGARSSLKGLRSTVKRPDKLSYELGTLTAENNPFRTHPVFR